MGRLGIVIATLVLLTGCAQSSPHQFANGTQGFHIACHGTTSSMSDCHEKATEVCQGGYDVVDSEGRRRRVDGYSITEGVSKIRNVQGGYVDTSGGTVTRDLYVRCLA